MKTSPTLLLSLSPYYKIILVTFVVFVLIIAPIEFFLHSTEPDNALYETWPLMPLLNTHYAPIIDKLDEFNTLNADNHYNCILVGSSLAEYLDPTLIAEQVQQQTGQDMTCYNFALMDASASSVSTLLALLLQTHEFDLVVWGVQAHHFFSDPAANENRFTTSPWVRYTLGDFNVEGWLYDHSYFYRALNIYLPLIFSPDALNNVTDFVRSERDQQLVKSSQPNGYTAILGYKDSAPWLDPTGANAIDYLPALQEPSAADWDALTTTSKLARVHDFTLVVVAFPVSTSTPAAVEFMDEVAVRIKALDIPFLDASELQLPVTAYCDTVASTQYDFIHNHLHVSGSMLFSTWVGAQIGQALVSGAVNDVNDPLWEPGAQVVAPDYMPTLGLSDEHYTEYTQFRDTFELLPPDARVLNPSPVAFDRVQLQTSLGLLLEWQTDTPPETWQADFTLMTVFDRMVYPGELALTDAEQNSLDGWYRSAEPDLLRELGVDYVLCRVEPDATATVHCPAEVATTPGYTLMGDWEYAPHADHYLLYRMGA